MKKSKSRGPKPWFIKVRGSYLPNSWQGWFLYIPLITIAIYILAEAKRADDMLWWAAPRMLLELIGLGTVFTWLAKRTS